MYTFKDRRRWEDAYVKNESRAFVRTAVNFRLTGAYSCNTKMRRGFQDDGMVWNFTTNQYSEMQYRAEKIMWGSQRAICRI